MTRGLRSENPIRKSVNFRHAELNLGVLKKWKAAFGEIQDIKPVRHISSAFTMPFTSRNYFRPFPLLRSSGSFTPDSTVVQGMATASSPEALAQAMASMTLGPHITTNTSSTNSFDTAMNVSANSVGGASTPTSASSNPGTAFVPSRSSAPPGQLANHAPILPVPSVRKLLVLAARTEHCLFRCSQDTSRVSRVSAFIQVLGSYSLTTTKVRAKSLRTVAQSRDYPARCCPAESTHSSPSNPTSAL